MTESDGTEDIEQSQETAELPHVVNPAQLADVTRLADRLVAELQGVPDGDLVGQIIENALKLLRDQTNRGDIKLINKSFKELRYALKVFAPYRDVPKVSIFGSARTAESHSDYKHAAEFAKRMADVGWMVITGAGGGSWRRGMGGRGLSRALGWPFGCLTSRRRMILLRTIRS